MSLWAATVAQVSVAATALQACGYTFCLSYLPQPLPDHSIVVCGLLSLEFSACIPVRFSPFIPSLSFFLPVLFLSFVSVVLLPLSRQLSVCYFLYKIAHLGGPHGYQGTEVSQGAVCTTWFLIPAVNLSTSGSLDCGL